MRHSSILYRLTRIGALLFLRANCRLTFAYERGIVMLEGLERVHRSRVNGQYAQVIVMIGGKGCK